MLHFMFVWTPQSSGFLKYKNISKQYFYYNLHVMLLSAQSMQQCKMYKRKEKLFKNMPIFGHFDLWPN